MRVFWTRSLLTCCLAVGLLGCGGEDVDPPDPPVDAANPDLDPVFGCTPGEVPCIDDVILDLSLHDDRTSTGDVSTTEDRGAFVSTVDATAGGFGQSNENAFLYMRFEAGGLVKVDIDDETALESEDWHIAARRFVVRLNGGNSGPGCIGAFRLDGQAFDDVTVVPEDGDPVFDDYYDGSCNVVEDGSGLPGSPNVALTGWWAYTTCVTTTSTPFVVPIDADTAVKLVVENYYETNQEGCNTSGNPGSNGGVLRVRWQFL